MTVPTPDFNDRACAAWLGLAIGDSYGRPLEFLQDRSVRTAPAGPPHDYRWTDDTHMSLYLGRALLDHGAVPFDADRFGSAVGHAFERWLDDPMTPSTAPGTTCQAGTRRWVQSRDWRTSGVPTSDGCGAVMRIAPLAMAWSGPSLTEAARVQAMLTHGHPNAQEAAAAGSWLLRRLLEGATLSAALVEEAALLSEAGALTGGGPTVAEALRAAINEAAATDSEWLDEAAIPAGDGGWRSPSALGLALAAALRWGLTDDGRVTHRTFQEAIDKAARIYGDSDSVACLAGMFLGAAGGRAALPGPWLMLLPARTEIESLALAVVQLGARGSETIQTRVQPRAAVSADEETYLVVSDLHGHREHLRALLARANQALGEHYVTVLLGDYVDNGPDVPGLLDDILRLRQVRRDRFVPIVGNHDLACLRALGWPARDPDTCWFDRMRRRYWNAGQGTDSAYGATSAATLKARMPERHQTLLWSMPWCFDTGTYLFVHAGMQAGPLAPQRRQLTNKLLPSRHGHLPPQIRDKALCAVHDPTWDRVVVSAHTRDPASRAGVRGHGPHIIEDRRICLSGEVDQTGTLYAIELPSRRIWTVNAQGEVSRG